MSSGQRKLQPRVIVVNDRPLCYWHSAPQEAATEFLSGLKPSYFEEVAEILEKALDTSHKSTAAAAIRLTFGQAVEALFTFIFAALQAPLAPQAWVALAMPRDLRALALAVSEGRELLHLYQPLPEAPTWHDIARLFAGPAVPTPERPEEWAKHYGPFWASLAHELCDPAGIAEYNAIKHGMRVALSGHFTVVGGHVLSDSEFGSRFFPVDKLGSPARHIKTRMCLRNWDPHGMVRGLRPIADSLRNIIAILMKLNEPEHVSGDFELRFPDLEDFDAPWSKPRALSTLTLSTYEVPLDRIGQWNDEQLLASYRSAKIEAKWSRVDA